MNLEWIKWIFLFLGAYSYASEYHNEFGPDYGTKWLLFVDDNGETHEMNFSVLPLDTRSLLLGDVYFYLYTRQNMENRELLSLPEDGSPIQSKYFNESNDIRVVTHGWMSKETTEWLQSIKNRFIQTADINVITVDWHEISQNPFYPWAALCTRYVGKRTSKLLGTLSDTFNLNNSHIHLIGHSLGAHVMGYVGNFSKQRIQRITARPMFELPMMAENHRLEKSDAQFVDIIHTCAGVYGYKFSHGHADFYPNNGKPCQPGCGGGQNIIEGCSHGRSHQFFLESINSDIPFLAYPCESWDDFAQGKCKSNATPMGYLASPTNWGEFYLHTKNESTFATGE
ncbi:unnamed protein product [Diatraea saccharalis]|uniref:Lipase domain-containing protein n=1 Tax=Diatraea saccharalis TaxID=40085 RepID=A0A9N9WBP3_9NEOP|nr:unnamed protein product [Diatraea saccharalis]